MRKSVLLLMIMLCTLIFSEGRKILLIESYHSEYLWDASYIKGLDEELGDGYEIVKFQMDTKRIPTERFQEMADKAWKKYKECSPELVVIGDDNAFKFLGEKFSFESIPVVYLGINNNPRYYVTSESDNITGVLERPLLKKSVFALIQIVPDIKNVLILFDSGTTSEVVKDDLFGKRDSFKIRDVVVTFRSIGDWDQWKKTVEDANIKYDAIIVGLYHTIKDSNQRHIDANEVLEWTSKNSKIPPFAFWDFAVGENKAIGGLVLAGKTQGEEAAKIIKRILEDDIHPRNIFPKIAERGRLLFSKKQLDKYNLVLPEEFVNESQIIE